MCLLLSGSIAHFFSWWQEVTAIRSEIIDQIWREIEPELATQGYELVEVEYGGRTVRLFIDKVGGVTLDDCTAVSQLVGAVMDARDFIQENYMLEVSSPGIERPVRKTADFERFVGEKIKLATHMAIAGRKRFHGVLRGIADGLISIECDDGLHQVHIENVKKANLDR